MTYNELRKGRVSLPGYVYSVTTVTERRLSIFSDWRVGRLVVHEISRAPGADTLAFVVMPDHVHWLFALTGSVSLARLVGGFKGRSAHAVNAALGRSGRLWQPGFHDHAIRADEDARRIARYIIANPLRARLVERVGDYPLWDATWLDALSG